MSYIQINKLKNALELYCRAKDDDEKKDRLDKMEAILSDLRYIGCSSDYQRHVLQLVLDDVSRKTHGKLTSAVNAVYGKIVSEGRARFQVFCSQYNIKNGDFMDYSHGIDFRKPTSFYQIKEKETMYQWCRVFANGELSVGQWFTKTEVDPIKLGITPHYDVLLRPDFKRHQGTGSRVLCSFIFPFQKNSFQCIAAGTLDSWNWQRHFDGEYIENDGHWAGGGAMQFFVPLTDNESLSLAKCGSIIRRWDD